MTKQRTVTRVGSKMLSFRANSITLRILTDLQRYYQENTLGAKKVNRSGAILAAIWDAYQQHAAAGHITAAAGKSRSKRLALNDVGLSQSFMPQV